MIRREAYKWRPERKKKDRVPMTDIAAELRRGIDPDNTVATEKLMDDAADEIERLRAALDKICGITFGAGSLDNGGKIHAICVSTLNPQ